MITNSKSLRSIFSEHQGKVSDKWSIYISEYDRLFQTHRDIPITLLEIGVQNGGSLEIWSKFFDKAVKLIGCDINPACAQLQFDSEKISIVIGDANKDEAYYQIMELEQNFDLIIDDGSHKSGDIVRSFLRYFNHLNEDGLYLIEDLHCSYWTDYEGGLLNPCSSIEFFKKLIDIINYEHWGVSELRSNFLSDFNDFFKVEINEEILSRIHSIEFINSICLIKKCSAEKNNLGVRVIAGLKSSVDESPVLLAGRTCPAPNQRLNPWSTRRRLAEKNSIIYSNEINDLKNKIDENDRANREDLYQIQEKYNNILKNQVTRERDSTALISRVMSDNQQIINKLILRHREDMQSLIDGIATLDHKFSVKSDNNLEHQEKLVVSCALKNE